MTQHAVRVHPISGLDGFEVFEGVYPAFRFPRHAHPHFTVSVLTDGEQRFEHHGCVSTLRSGDVVLLNPDQAHANEPASEFWSHISVCFSETLLSSVLPEFRRAKFRLGSTVVADRELSTAVARLLSRSRKASALELQELACRLLGLVFCRHSSGSRPQAASVPVEIVRERLNDAPESNVSLLQLAEDAGTSGSTLLRSFTTLVGCTPHAYQTARRLDRGKRLLRQGADIADTGLACGFVDQSHFTHTFMKWLGITPGRYRAQMRVADKKRGDGAKYQ